MAIFNQYGTQVSSQRLYKSSYRYQNGVPWTPKMDRDFRELFNSHDFTAVMTQSRLVYSNMGVPKAAIDQKATMVAGDGWELEHAGDDADWGAEAVPIMAAWLDRAEVSGRCCFSEGLKTDSVAVSRDGDFFILLLLDDNGMPRIQKIPAHRVGSGEFSDGVMDKGPYVGRTIQTGVVTDGQGRVVAYQIVDPEMDHTKDVFIPAENMIHVNERDWHDQTRGVPEFAASFNQLRQSELSQDWELLAQQMVSSYALVEYNDEGMPDMDDPLKSLNTDIAEPHEQGLVCEEFAGGAVKYFQSNSGGKIETMNSSRPSDMWDRFQDRIGRLACAGAKWPFELVWDPKGLNGNSVRHVQEMARMSVSARQCTLLEAYRKVLAWGASVLIARGVLPMPSSPMDVAEFGFIMPAKFSIDPRHDAKTQIELYKIGMVNLTQILREKKRKLGAHYDERCHEVTLRDMKIKEWEEKTGVTIDKREIIMLTPNEMAEDSQNTEDTTENETV